MALSNFISGLTKRVRWRPLRARPAGSVLALRYLAFKDLIAANDGLLEIIADIEQRLVGHTWFGMAFVRSAAVNSVTHAYRIIANLDALSSRRFQELHPVFLSLQSRIESAVDRLVRATDEHAPLVYALADVPGGLHDRVGGKAANIAEVRNQLGLPVPEGFVITTDAFAAVLAHDRLGEEVRARQAGIEANQLEDLNAISREVCALIGAATIPPPVADAVVAAYDRLAALVVRPPRVAMRSSAVGEDGVISFAGQYATVLNVTREGLLDAYKEVLCSLYSPRALFYRSAYGIAEEEVPMAVLCMEMVDAEASGVACSRDPNAPGGDLALVTGAWGLGVATVGGSVTPDSWSVSRAGSPAIVSRRAGMKDTTVEALPGGGLRSLAVPAPRVSSFCLSDVQVRAVAVMTLAVESHFAAPQEIEWALDAGGRFLVLQARPLLAGQAQPGRSGTTAEDVDEAPILTGAPASNGCAAGPVVICADSDDLSRVPAGAILVTRHSSPHFVGAFRRVSAIVTDVGAAAGHMASLAREFGLPAVLGTGLATSSLRPGQIVTVDATSGHVYAGRVERVLQRAHDRPDWTMKGTPAYALLREIADVIVPLNLTDPRAPSFQPRGCRTLHDVARFAHEKVFDEMFRTSDRVADATAAAVRLAEPLPFALLVIDIGRGLRAGRRPGPIRAADIQSEPMRALLAGMMHPDLRWSEPKRISLAGFLSVATETMITPRSDDGQRDLGDRSYAIVAEAYCNFSSRIGYHFAAVDAYCSDSLTRNYISFRFRGGAADFERRSKRCEVIAAILARLDFQIERTGDSVNARLRKYHRDAILTRLDQLGRLIIVTRQLDMRMGPNTPIEWYVRAFLDGNYLFEPAGAGGGPSRPGDSGR